MAKTFNSKDGSAPFPRTADEWTCKLNPETGAYFTAPEAEHKVAKDVFGHDYQKDQTGSPIERGKGSALQPTAQHKQALMISQDAEAARKMRMGWHPGLESAFDPKQAEIDRLNALLAKRGGARRKAKVKKPMAEAAA